MKAVLVTGGAGNLGRRASWELLRRGHDVRVLTHRSGAVVDGVEAVVGNVVSGASIDEATVGINAIVHTATHHGGPRTKSEVAAARTIADAAAAVGAHLVYVSQVGVDANRSPHYDAKWQGEGVVERLGTNWSIQRVTHFHDRIEQLLRAPVVFKTPGLAFQPVDVLEVAARLADIVEAGPSGRVPDFGGPELLGIETLARRRRRITGRRSLLVRAPRVGRIRDSARGSHLSPAHRDGTVTWGQWLRRSVNSH